METSKLDYSKIENVEIDYDPSDYPDFVDAYITYAEYDGAEMTDEQLDELNNNSEFIYEELQRQLY